MYIGLNYLKKYDEKVSRVADDSRREGFKIRKEATEVRRLVCAFTSELAASLSARTGKGRKKYLLNVNMIKIRGVIRLTSTEECSSREDVARGAATRRWDPLCAIMQNHLSISNA